MTKTHIKVCGITDADQAAAICATGVDALGVIVHANSPRLINVQRAQQIRARVPATVKLVGVVVDMEIEALENVIDQVGFDYVQLHGNETNEYGRALSIPFVKAIRAKDPQSVTHSLSQYTDANAVLLDPYVSGVHGGTGQLLDAQLWPKKSTKPLVLAGGLNAKNVGQRIKKLRPWAVDLNSGVEKSSGFKDLAAVADAVQVVRGVDRVNAG